MGGVWRDDIPKGWQSAAQRFFDAHEPEPARLVEPGEEPERKMLLRDTPMGDRGVEYVLGDEDLPEPVRIEPNPGSYYDTLDKRTARDKPTS